MTVVASRGVRLSSRVAFWIVGSMLALLLFSSTVPSPMYVIYQQRWHFSAGILTIVFGIYAVTVLTCLLLFGALSDAIGRRPVLLGSLAIVIASMVVFAFAQGVVWLLVARALQGIGVGTATGALSAAVVEMEPVKGRGTLVNATGPAAGIAIGALIAGILVQYAPAPTVLSYVVLIIAFAIIFTLLTAIPETAPNAGQGVSARPHRLSVPPSARRPFVVFSLVVVALWAIGGLYMALGPSLVLGILHSTSHVLGGLAVTAFAGLGVLTQIGLRRHGLPRPIVLGAVPLLVGLALLLVAMFVASAVVFFVGSIVLGIGWGAMYSGAFSSLSALAEPARRGELLAAVYVVAYLSMSVPVVAAGYAIGAFGLRGTTSVFILAVAGLTAVALVGLRWARPGAAHVEAAGRTLAEPCPCPCSVPHTATSMVREGG